MGNERIETIMREVIKNAETGSAFITLAGVLGARLQTIQFAASKGNKVLCALGVETSLAVTGGTVTAAAAKQAYVLDELRIQIDNQLRMDSTEALALVDWADTVLDKAQSDTVLTAAGTARSYHLYPISGAGGKNALIDIDFAAFATMYSAGTAGALAITITPYYAQMAMPVFTVKTGKDTVTATGMHKMQVSGDFIGNGYLDSALIIGDGTTVLDDFIITQSNGLSLFKAKAPATALYWQSLHQKTNHTNILSGVYVDATKRFDINDKIELDISTAGSWYYALIFKNSPTTTDKGVTAPVPTKTVREDTQPTQGGVTEQAPDQREILINQSGAFRRNLRGVKNFLNVKSR